MLPEIHTKRLESHSLGPVEKPKPAVLENRGIRFSKVSGLNQARVASYWNRTAANLGELRETAPTEVKLAQNSSNTWTVSRVRNSLYSQGGSRQFDRLMPEQQEQFVQLVATMEPRAGARIPEDLVTLLRSGKLTERDLKGGTLLDSLAQLSTQELASGLDRKTLLTELVERIVDPRKISQRNRGTCTVTSLEFILASKKPAEFARIITGLCSRKGTVKLADGSTMKRDASCLEPDDSGRATIDRIFQSSAMEYGNGLLQNYDNREDENEVYGFVDTGSGLSGGEFDDVIDGISGQNYSVNKYEDSQAARTDLTHRFQRAIADGHHILVAMRWSNREGGKHGYHQVVLLDASPDRMSFWNPWGDGEQGQSSGPPRQVNTRRGAGHFDMSPSEFFQRLTTYHLPPGY